MPTRLPARLRTFLAPFIRLVAAAGMIAFPMAQVDAQELEPRLLTNVPVGMNFALLAFAHSRGNVLLDPSIPIEDLDSKLNTFIAAYVRTLSIFGLAGKVDVIAPLALGDWHGTLAGVDTSRSADGFGDPRVRLSVNFVGSPALRASEFREYQQKTIVGASLQVIAPLGQYDNTRLINLGSNRWTFRPQLGVSHHAGNWFFEWYNSIWIFGKNGDFLGGQKLTQNPLYATKLHVIRTLPRGMWIAVDGGFGIGGRSYVDDVPLETRISGFRFGLNFAVPVAPQHTFRLTVASGVRIERGPDFDLIGVSYQFRWGGM